MQRHLALSAAVAGVTIISVLSTRIASAAPYAAAISETSGTVSFTLNEVGSSVTVIRDGVATSLGALPKGVNTFARNGATSYQIVVSKLASSGGYQDITGASTAVIPSNGQPIGTALNTAQPISADTIVASRFNNPKGVTVNTNPANGALFGRIYVTNGSVGTTTIGTTTRSTGKGVYALNADLTDAVGQGDTAKTGGITFGTSTNSPWKVSLDDDGFVYVNDQVDAVAGVHRLDPNLGDTSGTNVLIGTNATVPAAPTTAKNHGSIYGTVLTGSAAAGNLKLYTIDEDLTYGSTTIPYSGLDSMWRYDLGSTVTDYSALPTQLATGLLVGDAATLETDIARSKKSGKFYLQQYRGVAGGGESQIFVVAADGVTKLFGSRDESINAGLDADPVATGTQDVMRGVHAIEVSPDEHFIAGMTADSQVMITPLIDGIPDIANRSELAAGQSFTDSGWDVSFDAADNVYAVATNGTFKAVRVFAPGAVSQTAYGSDGTFKTITEQSYNGSGNLSDSSKWLLNSVANSNDAVMSIGNLTTGTQSINSDAASAASRIRFSGGNYTIGGTGTITMGAGVLEPRIIAEAGNQTITAPLSINKSFGVAAYAGASLTLTNVSYGSFGFYKMTKWSDGKVTMPTFKEGTLDIKGGTLAFNTPATGDAAYTTKLEIAGTTAAPTSTLDLGSSAIVIDYPDSATDPVATITSLIVSGYNSGAWTGKGITSALAAGNSRYGIGIIDVGDNPSLASPTSFFMGVPLFEPTNLLVKVTYRGDFDLNAGVDFNDLLVLAKHYGIATGGTWSTGDTDYNGTVDFNDLLSLAKNYGTTSLTSAQISELGGSIASDFTLARSLVPEPTTLSLLGLGALAMRRRRH